MSFSLNNLNNGTDKRLHKLGDLPNFVLSADNFCRKNWEFGDMELIGFNFMLSFSLFFGALNVFFVSISDWH